MIYVTFALNVAAFTMNAAFLYYGIGRTWIAMLACATSTLGAMKMLPYVLHGLRK